VPQPVGHTGQDGGDFEGGAAERPAGAGGVLDEETRGGAVQGVERPGHGEANAFGGSHRIAIAGGAGVETYAGHAESRGPLQLLGQAAGCATPFVWLGRGATQDVGGMDHDVGRGDPRFVQRGVESLHPLRTDRGLVTVELRDGGEDLDRRQSGVRGTAHRHVDAAIVHSVRAEYV
jgi:hypothetical protein